MVKKLSKGLVVLLMFVMMFSVTAIAATSKGKKNQTGTSMKKCGYVTDGKHKLKFKNSKNKLTYIKFTASEAKEYSFTVSDIVYKAKTIKQNGVSYKTNAKSKGFFEILANVNKYGGEPCWGVTKGGKAHYARVKTKNNGTSKEGNKINSYNKKRTFTTRLKKGETVYFCLHMNDAGSGTFVLNVN